MSNDRIKERKNERRWTGEIANGNSPAHDQKSLRSPAAQRFHPSIRRLIHPALSLPLGLKRCSRDQRHSRTRTHTLQHQPTCPLSLAAGVLGVSLSLPKAEGGGATAEAEAIVPVLRLGKQRRDNGTLVRGPRSNSQQSTAMLLAAEQPRTARVPHTPPRKRPEIFWLSSLFHTKFTREKWPL